MTDSKPDPIQEQMIAARREQILDAAIVVFADKGFHRATIKDIARQAGIADGTIYNYFANKTALMLGILERLNDSESRQEDFDQSLGGNFTTFVREYVGQRFETFDDEMMRLMQTVLSEVLIDADLRERYWTEIIAPTYTLIEPYVETWKASGDIRDMDSALTLRMFSATLIGLVVLRLLGDETLEERWSELPNFVTDAMLYGLLGEHHNHDSRNDPET